MENVKESEIRKKRIYESIVLKLLSNFKKGNLLFTFPDGETLIIGDGDGLSVDIKVKNNEFFKKCVFYGDVGFGESFCDGDWETSNLTDVDMYSPQSQALTVGSRVKEYVISAIVKVIHPRMRFHFLKFSNIISCKM